MRRYAFFLAAFLLFPSPAQAGGSIATVYVATKNPAPGQPISVQIGITTDDAAGWAASDYAFILRLRSGEGQIVSESSSIAGTQAVQNARITTSTVQWSLPQDTSGYYKLEIALSHNGTVVATSTPWTLVIANPKPSPPPNCVHGSQNSTANFGRPSESTVLGLNGCIVQGQSSYTLTGGFSSAPGSIRPVVEIAAPQISLKGGSISPQFDPLSLGGVTGDGALFVKNWGEQHFLQMTWLRQQGTPLAPSFAGLQYGFHSPTVVAGFGAGHIRSPSMPDYGGLSNWGDGDFATFSFTWQPPPQRNTFGFRFGLVNYMDADGVTRRVDRAYEAFATLAIGVTQWSLDELRTGPFFLAPGSPAIIADRDAQKFSGSFPLGQVSATLSVEGYHDDLPGAALSVKTNNWVENASFSMPVRNDMLTLTFGGGAQQQDGDFPSAFSTSGVTAVYLLRRGAQSVQFSYGVTGSNSGPDQQQTQVQSGIQISRAIAQGLSVTLGTNLTGMRASSMDSASFSRTNYLTLSFARDPWTISSSLSNSAMQPGIGLAPPQTLSLNEGLEFKLPRHLSLKLSMTKLNGSTSLSTGNIALGTQF